MSFFLQLLFFLFNFTVLALKIKLLAKSFVFKSWICVSGWRKKLCADLHYFIVMIKEVCMYDAFGTLKLSASLVRVVGIDSIYGFCIFN